MARLADFTMAKTCRSWSALSIPIFVKSNACKFAVSNGPTVVPAFACDVGASAGVGGRWVNLDFASNDVGASAGVGEVGNALSWSGYTMSFWFVVV